MGSPVAEVGAVISVRFSAEEFERVAERATEGHSTLAAFVRQAVPEKVRRRTER